MIPPRGPRSVLVVVQVTMSACGRGRGVHAGCDETSDVRHVHQQPRLDGFGNPCHAFEVDRPGIGRAAGDQQRRARLAGTGLDFVVIEETRLPVHAVVMGVEPAPREVCPGAVAEMPARR